MNNPLWQFTVACRENNIENAKELVKEHNITFGNARVYINDAFQDICRSGHFDMLKWFTTTFDLDNVDKIRTIYGLKSKRVHRRIRDGFHVVCAHGYLEMAQWMHIHFKLTIYDAKSEHWWPLFMSCLNDYTDVANWLIDTFGYTPEKYADNFSYICGMIKSRSDPKTYEFLMSKFNGYLVFDDGTGQFPK